MRKLSVLFLSVVFGLGVGVAPALAGPYVGFGGGVVFLEDADVSGGGASGEISFDAGYGLMAAIGTDFAQVMRGEVELAYRSNDIDEVGTNGDITSLGLMANAYYDIPTGMMFKPFIMGGIGYANVEVDNGGSDDDNVFAYQLGAGAGFSLSPQMLIDLQYRWFATEDPEFDGVEVEYMSHNILVGLRVNF